MFDIFDFMPPNVVTHFEPLDSFLVWFVDHLDGRFTIEIGRGSVSSRKRSYSLASR